VARSGAVAVRVVVVRSGAVRVVVEEKSVVGVVLRNSAVDIGFVLSERGCTVVGELVEVVFVEMGTELKIVFEVVAVIVENKVAVESVVEIAVEIGVVSVVKIVVLGIVVVDVVGGAVFVVKGFVDPGGEAEID